MKTPRTFPGQIALGNLVTELMNKDKEFELVKEAPPLILEPENDDPFAEADAAKEVIPEPTPSAIIRRKPGEDKTGFYHV